jgi:hypothetical protein
MLHQFTWQQFLIATLIFTMVWYAVVILLFYRDKIADVLSGRSGVVQHDRLKRVWEEDLEDDFPGDEELMGNHALPDGLSEVEMHMVAFVPKTIDKDDDLKIQLGIIPDFLEELKTIFHVLENENGNAEDFISMFSLVKSQHPNIRNTTNQDAINNLIRENLPFVLSEEEINRLWA